MKAIVLGLGVLGTLAPPAFAQAELAPGVDAGAATCAEFMDLGMAERVAMLAALPIGDEIDQADMPAAEGFADDVASACSGSPDRPLGDAARQTMGGD
jgi:hypothetical protein